TGTTVLVPGLWYVIEYFANSTARKARVYPDGFAPGADELSVATTLTSSVVNFGKISNRNGQSVSFDYDDIHVLEGGSDYLGDGKVILLPGNTAIPTYDFFTKSGGVTIASVWNDTPINIAKQALSSLNADVKQTIKHDPTFLTTADKIVSVSTVMCIRG